MEDRVLVLAPRGRDAPVAADLLVRHGLLAAICGDLAALLHALRDGAGAVLLTEEALASEDPAALARWIAEQPTWSDLPFVVLANGTRAPRTVRATARLADLGNVVLLQRPLHAEAMLGAVRSALKARRRQYEVRDAAGTLERAVIDRTAELEAARESLDIALAAAGMGSWDIDLTTGIARRTPRHDEIFGYPQPLRQWDVDVFLSHVDPNQRAFVVAAFDKALATGHLDADCAIVTHDGANRSIAVRGRVTYDGDGRPVRMAGVVSDVTAQKEADARLAQAQKMDAVGQLTGGVAHDFNNLLTPIVGSLDLVRRRHAGDERTQRLVGNALQAAERAATLTQRLLAFARRQALQPQAIDVGALIEGMIDLVRRSLGPTVAVSLDRPATLPAALVDPNQLELALLNLSINARDAMPRGGRLTLAVAADTIEADNAFGLPAGGYVRLVATDTGIGMNAETLARAAEPFFSTKEVGKGTGLGLSMVHGLAAQSGGALRLVSELGVGTSVELFLPATDEAAAGPAADAADPVTTPRAARVLLVDDEDIVRSVTADMLRDIGYVVVEAASGSQALATIRSGVEVDIIVTDYLMPGMTGGVLLKELRRAGVRTPALLVTGYAAAGDDVAPDVERLRKPFRQVELAGKVHELLGKGEPGDAPSEVEGGARREAPAVVS